MKSVSMTPLLLLLASLCAAAASPTFGKGSVFGISRGGGLFNGKKDEVTSDVASALASDSTGDKVMYPAMSQDEVEDWLAHIPVFAVTDSKGAGVVLRPDNDTSVFYFFMSPQMANATLSTLKGANDDLDLQVSAFSMGKIWFKMLEEGGGEVKLRAPGSDDDGETAKGVEYRLVPDQRDLMGARMLLTMDPADGERLKAGEDFNVEDAQKAVAKAMTESPKFKANFNEIPVFMIQQMRMQKQPAEGETAGVDPVTMLPMYFSLQNMVGTWQQFMAQAPDGVKDVEPAINLMALGELVELMQKESEIDFRNTLLVPPVPMNSGETGAPGVTTEEDQISQMGGDTLGDL